MSEITPEANPSEETVAALKKQYDEIVEKLAEKTQATANLVEEVKELRSKNQITEAQAIDLQKKLDARVEAPADGQASPERLAEIATAAAAKVLAERDTATAKTNQKNALASFIAKHREFHPENDEGGLKMSMLEKKLGQFNMAGLSTEAEFLSVFEDANKLVSNIVTPNQDTDVDPNPPAPIGGGGTAPRVVDDNKQLSSKEIAIIDRTFGGDRERYLKIRAKRPDYVATLLEYSR